MLIANCCLPRRGVVSVRRGDLLAGMRIIDEDV